MADWGGEFNFFQGIHVIVGLIIDIFISIRPMVNQIWQAGTSTGFDSNETNQAGADDVIVSRSREELKILYLHY